MKSSKKSTTVNARIRKYVHSYNFTGVVVGTLFMIVGFLPSLLPRGWVLQGVLSAVLFTIGYGLGLIASHVIRLFLHSEWAIPKKRRYKKYVYAVLAVLYMIAMIVGFSWQQEVRSLVGQPPEYSFSVVGYAVVGIALICFIMLVARSIRSLFGWLKHLIDSHLPKAITYTLAWGATAVLVIGILNGVIFSGAMSVLNSAYGTKNGTTEEGIVAPTSPELSGSSESLIAWESLGRQGRNFIGRTTTTKELTNFNKSPATQPVRIYAGLESADSSKERAELATADLKRAGGFERKVVVVVTTTGTGWVDEAGVDPVEYMYNGDSAVVSMQYSYLPSALSFLVDQTKAKDAGRDLYDAVHNEVLNMPAEKRPKIVVFGESLGSFGGEAAFTGLSSFRATSDGAVWAGPPNFNELRKTATANREPSSPEILPVFEQGENVRFAIKAPDFNNPQKPWGTPKAVYLQNSSDPIVWWSPSLLFTKPDWLSQPRGADVSSKTRWLPIVTFWQVSGDMIFSTGVPDGHGHKYGTLPTDAWSYVAPPAGWTSQKTAELKSALSD